MKLTQHTRATYGPVPLGDLLHPVSLLHIGIAFTALACPLNRFLEPA